MPGHIAVMTNMWHGHIYSALGLCSELSRRGYRVTYASSPMYAELIAQTGAEPIPIDDPQSERRPESKLEFELPSGADIDWWGSYAPNVFATYCDYSAELISQLEGFYEKNPPDVVVYDYGVFAGRIFAKRFNIPAVQISGTFAIYKDYIARDNGVFLKPEPMAAVSDQVDSFLSSHGLGGTEQIYHVEPLNIYFIPRQFQYRADWFDGRHCFVGACLNRPIRPQWVDASNGRPIILISDTGGSHSVRYFQEFISALSGSEFHVILSPRFAAVANYISKDLPRNFEVDRHTSHLEILPNTTLAVTQGGMGSTLEPIYHGIPVIAVPMYLPVNHEISYRVAELRVGLMLPGSQLSVKHIRQSVGEVLERVEYIENVKHLQTCFRSHGGASEAADRIERLRSQSAVRGT